MIDNMPSGPYCQILWKKRRPIYASSQSVKAQGDEKKAGVVHPGDDWP